jgi:hypothetical protein
MFLFVCFYLYVSATGFSSLNIKAEIQKMPLPTFVGQLGEHMLLNRKVTKVLENVRETVVKEVMKANI